MMHPPFQPQTHHHHHHHSSPSPRSSRPTTQTTQATRAYLHKEDDVEAALARAGFKVVKREMTATSFYFSRLLECRRVA